MLKYWLKLQKSDNCESKDLYENLFRAQSDNNVSNWLSEVRKILISIGTNDVWQQQTVENEKNKTKQKQKQTNKKQNKQTNIRN